MSEFALLTYDTPSNVKLRAGDGCRSRNILCHLSSVVPVERRFLYEPLEALPAPFSFDVLNNSENAFGQTRLRFLHSHLILVSSKSIDEAPP